MEYCVLKKWRKRKFGICDTCFVIFDRMMKEICFLILFDHTFYVFLNQYLLYYLNYHLDRQNPMKEHTIERGAYT